MSVQLMALAHIWNVIWNVIIAVFKRTLMILHWRHKSVYLKSPTTRLLVQFVHINKKGNIKAAHYWTFVKWNHWCYICYRGYPAKRALSAMREHGGLGPFGRIPSLYGMYKTKTQISTSVLYSHKIHTKANYTRCPILNIYIHIHVLNSLTRK